MLLKVAYDAQGHVTHSEPSADAPAVSPVLTQGARDAVAQWNFQPEVVGGHAIAGQAIVPFCYCLTESGRTPKEPGFCQWKTRDAPTPHGKDDVVALDSVAQLITDIQGHTL